MIDNLNTLRDRIHDMAVSKGWHDEGNDPARLPTLLCLVHSEVSEALEDYRTGCGVADTYDDERGKPCGIPSELADVIIRVLDICGLYGIDIDRAVSEKVDYNATRSRRHGGKRA